MYKLDLSYEFKTKSLASQHFLSGKNCIILVVFTGFSCRWCRFRTIQTRCARQRSHYERRSAKSGISMSWNQRRTDGSDGHPGTGAFCRWSTIACRQQRHFKDDSIPWQWCKNKLREELMLNSVLRLDFISDIGISNPTNRTQHQYGNSKGARKLILKLRCHSLKLNLFQDTMSLPDITLYTFDSISDAGGADVRCTKTSVFNLNAFTFDAISEPRHIDYGAWFRDEHSESVRNIVDVSEWRQQ